jgi:hypothetical protein
MLTFANERTVPPGGAYFYTVPETGVVFREFSLDRLMDKLASHYAENNLPKPGTLVVLVKDYMCRHFPVTFCIGDDDGKPRKKVVTLSIIRDETLKLAAGNPRVLPGEAKRRAIICSNCPKNDKQMCTSCSGLQSWARKLAGKSIEGLDAALGVCEIDATALSTKVHLQDIPDGDYPENCWRIAHADS